ncbi:hypothetical protein [Novosphingobium sp.]|uniref:hypothetical protein n=1 Tax=Novosphingobium sp. TaxID=1874826 RepID=UPI0031E0A8CD
MLTASAGTVHVGGAPFWAYALPITGMASMTLVTLMHRRWTTSTLVFLTFALQSGSILPSLVAGFWNGIHGWSHWQH